MWKHKDADGEGLTADELWEIDCMQRAFPEHSQEEILWAFSACRSEPTAKLSEDVVQECVRRRLKR